jgi:hypothetical protein
LAVKSSIVKSRIRKIEECVADLHDYLEVDPRELRKHLGRLNDFERYSRYVVEYLRL